MAEILEASNQAVQLVLIDSICPIVYHRCASLTFINNLFTLVNNIRRVLNINVKNLPTLDDIENRCRVHQIKYVFNELIATNNAKTHNALMTICALLIAYQNFHPKKLITHPLVIRCSETATTMEHLIPQQDHSVYATLGWSLTDSNVIVKSALPSSHLALINDEEIIERLATISSEVLLPNKQDKDLILADQGNMEAMQATMNQMMLMLSEIRSDVKDHAKACSLGNIGFFDANKEEKNGQISSYFGDLGAACRPNAN